MDGDGNFYPYQNILKENPILKLNLFNSKVLVWGWKNSQLISIKEPTHWKRPWSWERLKAKGEGGSRGEMVGYHHWPHGCEPVQTLGDSEGQRKELGMLQSMGSQRVGHNLATEQQA